MAGLSERLNKEEFIIVPEKIVENNLVSKKNGNKNRLLIANSKNKAGI